MILCSGVGRKEYCRELWKFSLTHLFIHPYLTVPIQRWYGILVRKKFTPRFYKNYQDGKVCTNNCYLYIPLLLNNLIFQSLIWLFLRLPVLPKVLLRNRIQFIFVIVILP